MSQDKEAFEPIAPNERLVLLDVLRGFALLGIALMNVEFFTRPLQGLLLGFDPDLTGIDRAVGWAIAVFVQGKFWTLFSLLFGMGFALMLERADALPADPDFNRIYLRRLAVLLLIGLAHSVLLWAGDILVPYALGGFALLLLFRNTPVPQLPLVGLAFYWIPLALLWTSAGIVTLAQLAPEDAVGMAKDAAASTAELRAAYAEAEAVYRDGNYFDVVRQRIDDTWMQWQWLPLVLPSIIGVFLLGVWFVRSGAMPRVEAHLTFFRKLLCIGGPSGAALALIAMPTLEHADMARPTLGLAAATTAMTFGSLLLCLAYLSALVLLLRGPGGARLQAWLAPAGRLALSNYLLQSLLFSTLFYGYGFGLWGEIGRAQQALLVLSVFMGQLLLSRWWLARYRFGPAEWVWRFATYGRAPPLRR